jgi:hypothetical protein
VCGGAKLERGMSAVRHGGGLSPIYRARGSGWRLVRGSSAREVVGRRRFTEAEGAWEAGQWRAAE